MKRILTLLAIVPLLLTSCTRDPYADFLVSSYTVYVGEMVYFTNRSQDAIDYEWDFGDGNFSINFNANHTWTSAGTKTVSLTAFGKDGKLDIAFADILVVSANPTADFTLSTPSVTTPGDVISFTNYSENSASYLWDFGDGYTSTAIHPNHYYEQAGNYTITLTSYGYTGEQSIATASVQVIQQYADLEITVEEYYEPYYLVTDISVRLYPTVSDWEDETNMIVEGYTGSDGKVLFLDVPIPYTKRVYVDVWGPNHDNYQLAAEDAGWIETDVLVPDVVNTFVAVVDYYEDGKKSGTPRIVLKAERKADAENSTKRLPEERKNIDKGIQTVR